MGVSAYTETAHDERTTCVLQCVAMCCSVLQLVAVCGSVWQCVAVCCSVLQRRRTMQLVGCSLLWCIAVYCGVLQSVAVFCSVLQCVAVSYRDGARCACVVASGG